MRVDLYGACGFHDHGHRLAWEPVHGGLCMGTLPVMWSLLFWWIHQHEYSQKDPQTVSIPDGIDGLPADHTRVGLGVPFLSPSVDMGNGHTAAGIECHQ